jgi:hypothetical protein
LKERTNIAAFVSSHGFGHAARISAVMAALQKMNPEIHFEIFTEVPEWFFLDTLPASVFSYHLFKTDIGLIQKSPLEEDIPATLAVLADFIPFDKLILVTISEKIKRLNCKLVLCDISPLGLAIAQKAGLPSVLIENFTWDWIYGGYKDYQSDFRSYCEYLGNYFESADYRIQTEPVCELIEEAMHVNPVGRNQKKPAEATRNKLGVKIGRKAVLVTLGGVPSNHNYIRQLHQFSDIDFILPINVEKIDRKENCIILPHHSEFYHPDLVAASDAVIGKLGYSTLAETYHSGIPFGFITRDAFRESLPLGDFVEKIMPSIRFTQTQFMNGTWIDSIPALTEIERNLEKKENGAQRAAELIFGIIDESGMP